MAAEKKSSKELAKVIEDARTTFEQKGKELREVLTNVQADIEQWKFSVEDTKEGTRLTLNLVALLRKKETTD